MMQSCARGLRRVSTSHVICNAEPSMSTLGGIGGGADYMSDANRFAFAGVHCNQLEPKPRGMGLTEIRVGA